MTSRILKQGGFGRHQQQRRLASPLQQGEGLGTPIGSESLTWSRLPLGRHGQSQLQLAAAVIEAKQLGRTFGVATALARHPGPLSQHYQALPIDALRQGGPLATAQTHHPQWTQRCLAELAQSAPADQLTLGGVTQQPELIPVGAVGGC